jgi:hypothetical protein
MPAVWIDKRYRSPGEELQSHHAEARIQRIRLVFGFLASNHGWL